MTIKSKKTIPYGRQNIDENDISSVVNVLKGDFITQGDKVPEFEKLIAEKFSCKYAIAVNSATSALHIACLALEVGDNDIVWTTANSFVASSNCALYCGAQIDFIDIDISTYNLSLEKLEEKLLEAKKANKLPKVLIAVHFAGHPCDMQKIMELSLEYKFKIMEDASHAIGSRIESDPIGCCKWSDITIFSFHPVKIMTTGEGGMALTNSKKLDRKMKLLRSHGITRDPDLLLNKDRIAPWYYEQQLLGFNYRMTDIQASLGISQLEKVDSFVEKRNEIAAYYYDSLSDLNIKIPEIPKGFYSAFHLFVILLDESLAGTSHKEIFCEIRVKGIEVNLHYMPIYLQPYYSNLDFVEGYCPLAESFASRAISLPIYPNIGEENLDYITQTLTELIK
jgi:UDP-4-amino-4,6-dideoxy-N-acetyl-beta-L-altrosamine transaminase